MTKIIRLRFASDVSSGIDAEDITDFFRDFDDTEPELLEVSVSVAVSRDQCADHIVRAVGATNTGLVVLDASLEDGNWALWQGISQVLRRWQEGSCWRGPDLLIVTTPWAQRQLHPFADAIEQSPVIQQHVGTFSLDGHQRDGAARHKMADLATSLECWEKRTHFSRLHERLRKYTIRLRGVYYTGPESDRRYFKFKYSLRRQAIQALVGLLENYVISNSVGIILWDANCGCEWLEPALDTLNTNMGSRLRVCRIDDIHSCLGVDVDATTIQKLGVCVLTGAAHEGKSLRRCSKQCKPEQFNAMTKLAIIADKRKAGESDTTGNPGWKSMTLNGSSTLGPLKIDYFMDAKIEEASLWEVEAATLLGQTKHLQDGGFEETDDCARLDPDDGPWVAMWSLLSDLGADTEAKPQDMHGRRDPVLYFPSLERLSEPNFRWDAHWLAEVMTRRFCHQLRTTDTDRRYVNRLDLLVVVPSVRTSLDSSPSSAQWITGAFNRRCGVATYELPRDLIYNNTTSLDTAMSKQLTVEFSANRFVLFDETAVKLQTIHGMSRLLSLPGQTVDSEAAGIVVDLGHPDREPQPRNYFALVRYDHVADVKDVQHEETTNDG
ncbi:MAG: hypothetical protein LBM94_04225 [Propionibacteriaceae bacterium]|jgi:hypothetical protein|nr:hypothetical protein [Propionibacteriaceae bacterium]